MLNYILNLFKSRSHPKYPNGKDRSKMINCNGHWRTPNRQCEVCGRLYFVYGKKPKHMACKGKCKSVIMKRYPEEFHKPPFGWNKDIPQSKEVKEKIKKALLGRKHHSKESKNALAIRMKGNQYWRLVKPENRLRGEQHLWWKGGKMNDKKIIYNSSQYKQWRKSVFDRDNWTCQECGARNGNGKNVYLEAHHIKQFSQHPESRFDLDNGLTLCRDCHLKTDSWGSNKKGVAYGIA